MKAHQTPPGRWSGELDCSEGFHEFLFDQQFFIFDMYNQDIYPAQDFVAQPTWYVCQLAPLLMARHTYRLTP